MPKRIVLFIFLLLSLATLEFSLHAADQEIRDNSPPVLARKDNTYFRKVTSIVTAYNHAHEFVQREKLETTDILVVIDWDNTISMINGSSLPFREEALTTKTIQALMESKFPLMILTSRLIGNPAVIQEGNEAKIHPGNFSALLSCASNMMTALNIIIPPVFTNAVYNYTYQPSGLKFGQYVPPPPPNLATLVYKNIVFAGASDQSVKGASLTYLLDNNYFIHRPKVIIFIDNDLGHVESVFNAFSKRPEIVVGLYFPQEEAETKDKISLLAP